MHKDEKRIVLITIISCLILILCSILYHAFLVPERDINQSITVGFLYEGDESAPYTYNFIRVNKLIESTYGDSVHLVLLRNVPEENAAEGLEKLVQENCDLIFTTSYGYGDAAREFAERLIQEGCVILAQHTNTIGPAEACEEAAKSRPVYHIGYNQSMLDVAPATSLVSCRINWTPYIMGAIEAVLQDQDIEDTVDGTAWDNDMCGGFEQDWIQMVELNTFIAAEGTEEIMEKTISDLQDGSIHVFQGDYIGVDPYDPSDTWDLHTEFKENKNASAPSFHYVLQDVIQVVDHAEAE